MNKLPHGLLKFKESVKNVIQFEVICLARENVCECVCPNQLAETVRETER